MLQSAYAEPVHGQRMANNNIKQGIDLVQTAEGGLGEIQGILSRMRELAIQAASNNLNINDRFSIDLEYQQLKQEVNRIANSTNYNNMNLLDGSRGGTNGVGRTQGTAGSSETRGTGEITNITDVVTGLGLPQDVTVHNDQIYWTDANTSKIQRADFNLASSGLGDGTSDLTLQIGANNSTDDRMTFGIDSVTTDSLLLADTDVDTLSEAQTTINSLDAAIDFINDQRSNLGAVQNRLGFANSNLMSSIQNTESSLSTIRDADFALEASNLARTQILTQSGTAG